MKEYIKDFGKPIAPLKLCIGKIESFLKKRNHSLAGRTN